MRASLLEQVVGIMAGHEAVTPEAETVPTFDEDVQIHMPKAPAVMKEVRSRLVELQQAEKEELVAQRKELEEKHRAEMKIVKEADASVDSLMKEGLSREEIIARRSEGSVAEEIAHGLKRQIVSIEGQIEKIDGKHNSIRERVIKGLEGIEVSMRAWMLDYVTGGNTHKLNPDRSQRAYGALLQREEFVREKLKDDDLAARAVLACGTMDVPGGGQANVWDTILAVMPQRYHEQFNDNTPEIVLGRLHSAITTTSPEEGAADE